MGLRGSPSRGRVWRCYSSTTYLVFDTPLVCVCLWRPWCSRSRTRTKLQPSGRLNKRLFVDRYKVQTGNTSFLIDVAIASWLNFSVAGNVFSPIYSQPLSRLLIVLGLCSETILEWQSGSHLFERTGMCGKLHLYLKGRYGDTEIDCWYVATTD